MVSTTFACFEINKTMALYNFILNMAIKIKNNISEFDLDELVELLSSLSVFGNALIFKDEINTINNGSIINSTKTPDDNFKNGSSFLLFKI